MASSNKFYGIVLLPVISIIVLSIVFVIMQDRQFEKLSEEYISHIEQNFIRQNREAIKSKVMLVNNMITFENDYIEKELKADLKDKLAMAINLADKIYQEKKDRLPYRQLRQEIIEQISNIRFYEGRGYYHIIDYDTGVAVGHGFKEFIGKSFENFKDDKGTKIIQAQRDAIARDNPAFVKLYFFKPGDSKTFYPKLIITTKYEPLNLIIGTGEYLDVVTKKTQAKIIEHIGERNKIDSENYLFIHEVLNMEGGDHFAKILTTMASGEQAGTLISSHAKDAKGFPYRDEMLKQLKQNGEAFVTYHFTKPDSPVPSPKLSYFYYQKDWNWILGSGFYLDDYEKELAVLKQKGIEKLHGDRMQYLITVLVVLLAVIAAALAAFLRYRKVISSYTRKIEQQNIALLAYQNELEDRVRQEVTKRQEQEALLLQQTKFHQMGEMLTGITHHWRQPLNVIALVAQGLEDSYEFGELDSQVLKDDVNLIVKTTQQMSETINSFRSFVVKKEKKREFGVTDTIHEVVSLLKPTLDGRFISLEVQLENDLHIWGEPGYLANVLQNILSNAQEELEKQERLNRKISITLNSDQTNIRIDVADNGPGIPKDVIERIFDPFFTTKEMAYTTGTGLYFSKLMIEQGFGGTLTVRNREQGGACFTITIPKSDQENSDE